MRGVSGYKYQVIQFLEVPYKGIADFVCVPRSWVQSRGGDVPIVKVSYPVEEPSLTENRVINRKRKSDSWNSFLSIVRYGTDNYENAKMYVQQEINNSKKNNGDSSLEPKNIQDRRNKSQKKNGGHTLLSAKANEKTSIPKQNAMSRATIGDDAFVVGMIDALGWCVSSKSANTVTLKRKALSGPDKKKHNKRFRVTEPDKSDNQIAGPSNEALDWSSKNHLSPTPEDSDEDLCTQETLVEKFNDNSTELRQTVNQNPSKTNHSLDPKIIAQLATSPMFAKWCMLMKELQEVFDNSLFKELINNLLNKDNDGSALQNNDPIPSTSSDTTLEAPKLNKEKISEESLKEKGTDNDDKDQPLKKKRCPKRIKKLLQAAYDDNSEDSSDFDIDDCEELPPEYDANDSRWTLKYREAAPGLVELMPDTGVYVCAERELPNYNTFPKRFALARRLLIEIFNYKALKICTLTNREAEAIDRDETNVSRPALDEHAISVLINYVTDHAKKEGWPKMDTRNIVKSLRNKMRYMRTRATRWLSHVRPSSL